LPIDARISARTCGILDAAMNRLKIRADTVMNMIMQLSRAESFSALINHFPLMVRLARDIIVTPATNIPPACVEENQPINSPPITRTNRINVSILD